MTNIQKQRFIEVALQALIAKLPLLDTHGTLGKLTEHDAKAEVMKGICQSACEYADWMEIIQKERYGVEVNE